MNNFFADLYSYFHKRPLFLKSLFILILVLSLFSASKLGFVEDISTFLPQNESNKKINFAYQHLGAANKIVISFKHSDNELIEKELLTDAVSFFSEYISQNDTSQHIKHILYEIDMEDILEISNFLVTNMPYFLTDNDYARIDTLLTIQNIESQLYNNKQLLLSPMGTFIRNVLIADPLHFSNKILQGLSDFQLSDTYQIDDGFIFNRDGTEALVTITSAYPISETAKSKLLIKDIENAIEKTKQEFENQVDISFFGASLISITNAEQIKKDSYFAISLSMFFILALLIFYFRNIKSLFLIFASVLFGMLFAFGMIVLVKNTISIIAVGAASILIGIAVNYPIHFLTLYKREKDMRLTIKEIANPLLIGNITTLGAFLSLRFISSDAMKDLGLFASLLLAGAIIFVLFFMPHFTGNMFLQLKQPNSKSFLNKIISFAPEKNRVIVSTILALTIILFYFSYDTSFETNMHTINYMTKEQRIQMEKMIKENADENKTIYCISEGDTPDEALQNYEKCLPFLDSFNKDSMIVKKSGIGIYLLSQENQQSKIKKWNTFWENRKQNLLENLRTIAINEGYKPESFTIFENILNKEYTPQPLEYFDIIQKNLSENYFAITSDKSMIFTILHTNPENRQKVDEVLNNINDNIFTFDNTSITEKLVSALSDDFDYVLYICGIIVFGFLLFSFGRIEIAIMAFIPLVVAWIWILGIMGIVGLKFNIVNIILATFIFGQGDDYTILVTEGLIYEYTHRKKMLDSFKKSIFLSACIMFLAIGMLIFSKHPAMRSLAEVTMIGMASVLLMAYIFPPLIFRLLTTKNNNNRLIPITLWNFSKTVISFSFFFFAALFLTVAGFFLITLGGKTKRNKEKFHRLLCSTLRLSNRMMIEISSKVENRFNENFEKPSIIICNHQSHIDLMYTLMLSPKIITLTNKWVWNTPFYGLIIRYADFLPVIDGIENNVEKLKELVADGYSILIFPEGTRSEDCSIKRFHKGAFYLADQLNLDILPIILHGVGHVFPKKEFLLRKGNVHIEILERIYPNNMIRLNNNYLETSKLMRKNYQEHYNNLCENIETPTYFKSHIYYNYIYKGTKIAQGAKKNLSNFDNLTEKISKLPNEGNILITNCGQGEFALLCALVKKRAIITATDTDPELLSIAKNCSSVPKNLIYIDKIENRELFDIIVSNE
ncbi:MAG: 1-acyl-sn-glycerol-3-phosphate acyltransferase [Marinilabiliaceae bacterium]|nr:1-acyl-sn-glycerol-3-phosphate acyltransferase [Marinilabiliaceae bacterium]